MMNYLIAVVLILAVVLSVSAFAIALTAETVSAIPGCAVETSFCISPDWDGGCGKWVKYCVAKV